MRFIGRLRPWHGLEMLLEVFHEGKFAEKGVRLLLIGDSPAYRELYHYVRDHQLSLVVTFTGPVERKKVPAHIAAIDDALQPSATDYACPYK